jgi:hypothetical protein
MSCTKKCYDKIAANAEVAKQAVLNAKQTKRAVWCQECNAWHVVTKPKR